MIGRTDRGGENLKVAYIFSQFPVPTQTFAVSDIVALCELGHDVSIHALKPPPGNEPASARAAGIPADVAITHLAWTRVWRWPALMLRHAGVALSLVAQTVRGFGGSPRAAIAALLCIPRALEICEEIEAEGANVVHLFWSRQTALVLKALVEMKAAPKRSAFVGAYDLVADDFLVRMAVQSSQVVFSHCEANRDYLAARCPPDVSVEVVHRGIPLVQLEEGIERDRNLWLTVSALVPEKNVAQVIEAFARARVSRPDLRLMVCGDGPQRADLERLAARLSSADGIEFTGHLDRTKIFRLMGEAELFLMLSTKPSERLPNVVKEAMWCGCSVIVAPTPGIEELVPDERFGSIVDPNSPSVIDRALRRADEETADEADHRRAAARAFIAERFSSTASMGRYADAWAGMKPPTPVALQRRRTGQQGGGPEARSATGGWAA